MGDRGSTRQQNSSSQLTTTADDHDVDAEHDRNVSRRASLAALRRQQNSSQSTGDQGGVMDDAAQPVRTPLPQVGAGKGEQLATEQALSVGDVFDPQRPALDGASQDTVLAIIGQNVNDLYQEVLLGQLATLKADLSKTAPVPETPFALKLLGWVVETVASGAVSYVGKFLGRELFGHEAPQEATVSIGGTESEPAVTTTSRTGTAPAPDWKESATEKAGDIGAEKGGAALKEKMLERPTTAPSAEEAPPAITTGGLLDEFIVRERHELLAKKSDIMARLMLMHEHAGGSAKNDAVVLQSKLRDLIGSPALTSWFRNKVTMEWLNFVSRVSLGPRAQGQTTDLIGANTNGGIAAGGIEAIRQWTGSDGMVEIHLHVPDTVQGTNGVALQRASIPSSFGAAQILQRLQGYNLATIPVYRRVWLQTGNSKLTETPAFVITPDGEIEADVGNPTLAAIGSQIPTNIGDSAYAVGGSRYGDEGRYSASVTSTFGTAGARLVRDILRGMSPQVLK